MQYLLSAPKQKERQGGQQDPVPLAFTFFSCTFFANNFAHSIFAMLAIGSSPVITVYLTRIKRKIADNRILPFPVNGSPSARFRKRNVNDVGKPTRTRPEARTKAKGEAEPLLLLWCGQQDLNLHESPHKNLNLTRLPISPCPLAFITISVFYASCQSFFSSFLSFL